MEMKMFNVLHKYQGVAYGFDIVSCVAHYENKNHAVCVLSVEALKANI